MNIQKIKIAFITSSLSKQGPVQVILDIVSNINFEEFDVSIIALKKVDDASSLYSEFIKFPINIYTIDDYSKYNIIAICRETLKFLKSKKIDIIHTHCFYSHFLSYILRSKYNSVHTIHIYPDIQTISRKGNVIGTIMNFLTKYFIKKIKYQIACSESISKEFKFRDNIEVNYITNGIAKPNSVYIPKKEIRKKLNLEEKVKYFIYVGRLSKEKNIIELINNFKIANIPNAQLLILGDGVLFDEALSIANSSVKMLGFQKNVLDYLHASDYYISASKTEGMPIAVLEALAVGLPLILSDIPPHLEILNKLDVGGIGFAYKNGNKLDFIEKLNLTLNANIILMKDNCIKVFDSFYTAERMSKEYQNLYHTIYNKK